MSESSAHASAVVELRRWWALIVLCCGVLMITVNATMVNVALPSIGLDLRFSSGSLVWVVNAYWASFGGFLFLGGRLADLLGHRRVFLFGISFFTLASLCCGLATSPCLLVAARFGQGLGGAIVLAVAFSKINLFAEGPKRAKALGILVCASAGGGAIGLLLGGVLTNVLSWHWVFLVNVPIGAGVYALCIALLPHDRGVSVREPLDVAGAVTVTMSLMLAVFAIVGANQAGWSSAQTITLLASALVLFILFVGIETRVQAPLISLELFRVRSLAIVSIVGAFLAAAMLVWSFISALYLQLVLRLSPMQVGLAFLPAHLTIAVTSLVVSPALGIRFGVKRLLVIGMLIVGVGLVFLAQAPVSANMLLDVVPGMLLLGVGYSIAYHPLLLIAINSVAPCQSGAASGIVNTSYTFGGALGLSVLASIAAARTNDLLVSGEGLPFALRGGYQVAYYSGAVLAALAALIGGAFLRYGQQHRASENIAAEIPRNILDDAQP